MSKKQAAGVLVLDPQGYILTFYAAKRSGGALPCGKVDSGEVPMQAAVRETLEETGYRVKLMAAAPYVAQTHDGYEVFTYLAELLDPGPIKPFIPEEGYSLWMPYTELLAGPYAEYNEGVLRWFKIL